ncbi:class I SAM-dependent methyltransferase [Trueperella bialowiezensis]|nr:class I SAM-dependent methyltransferase [Trueperella bialowiezensis]
MTPNPFASVGAAAQAYIDVRPNYPEAVLDSLNIDRDSVVLDVGAGTGKLTAQLAERSAHVWAVEPAADMRAAFAKALPDFPPERLLAAPGESLPVADQSVDVLTYGQSWHWLDERAAAAEAARVVRPGGLVAVLYNQLDVRQAWVHRLSRIMRSGDVHRADRPPDLRIPGHHGHMERPFTQPELLRTVWIDQLSPEQIYALGTTRSSWINNNDAGRARMRKNLTWYLAEHLKVPGDGVVGLPYQVHAWIARRQPAKTAPGGK